MTNSYDKDALVNALLGKSTLPTQSPFGSLFDPAPTPPTLRTPFGSLLGSTDFVSLFAPQPAPPQNT